MNKIRNKLLRVLILVTLLPTLLISAYSLYSTSKALKSNALSANTTKVTLLQKQIESYLAGVQSDLFFLRDSNALALHLKPRNVKDNQYGINLLLKNAQIAFKKFSKQKKIYQQVRYINAEGVEVIRIDYKNNKSKIISDTNLQNKSASRYVQESLALEQDGLLITDIELNREKGEIEQPHNPTIRYATPVFDKENKLQGIIVLNVNGHELLQIVSSHNNEGESLFFTDPEGFYYYHADESKAWGGDKNLKTGSNFYKDEENLAEQFKQADSLSTVETDNGILLYAPVTINNGNHPLGMLFSVTDKAIVLKPLRDYLFIFIGIAAFSLLLTFVIASVLANSIAKPLVSLKESVQNLSKGDMETPITTQSKDEVGELSHAIELLRKSMNILMKRSR
jgi:HAMP domain-containing protein